MSYFVRSHKRRKAFLDTLAVGGSLSQAASNAEGKVSNFKAWRASDPDFARDWEEAVEEGTDHIEDVATARAITKSDPLMQMILKARRPEKYDRGSKLELSGGISVEGSRSKLLNKIARLQAQGALLEGGPPALDALPGLKETREVEQEEVKQLEPPSTLHQPGPARGRKRRAAAGIS